MGSQPAGTTYCLAAGTFRLSSTITTVSGDRIIGAGETRPSSMSQIPPTNGCIFIAQGRTTFAELGISGARTPSDLSADCCSKNGTISPASCGKAIVNNSDLLTFDPSIATTTAGTASQVPVASPWTT